MRLFLVILLCLGLATCTSQIPQARILSPADASLAGRYSFALIDPPGTAATDDYRQLPQLLRQGLSARGYHESTQPQLRVHYWLAVQDSPLDFHVETAPPTPLGPYQALHRLRDSTGTLRIRLTTPEQHILWEGLSSTGLSPQRDSAELLERATQALLQQIPKATP